MEAAVHQLAAVRAADEKVDIDRAAEITGISKHTLYKKAAAGVIPSYKPGKHLQFKVADLEAYVESTRRGGRH